MSLLVMASRRFYAEVVLRVHIIRHKLRMFVADAEVACSS